jgi:hypothetical protein
MKKLFTVMAIFVLTLAACGDEGTPENGNGNGGNNSDVIGKWTGSLSWGDDGTADLVTLDIAQDTWVLVLSFDKEMLSYNGTWHRNGNNLTLISRNMSGTASLSGNTLILSITLFDGDPITIQLTKNSSPVTGSTSLKIQNESFSEITDVRWSNISFTLNTESVKNGSYVTKNVQEGNGYIYFKRKTNPINARTDELVIIEKNEQKVFVINDNTIIVDADNPNSKGSFGALGVNREPQITVQASGSPIAQFGDYDFGSALLNANKDVTFTIGNSGKADLKFNVVEGNVINLSNNTSGYFSVNQQPFATMTIAPGSTTTFVIRFSPAAVGNNFNAEVTIATNSENNKEFTFRVKGNGSNEYKIGDTGPGGGIIFFAQGGQYKECSGELGAYNWNDAVNTAKNYQGGGFTNWRLPDRGELDLLYRNRTAIGGFLTTYYWSSTEEGSSEAYYQSFYNGNYGYTYKDSSCRVRAVRNF